MVVLAEPDPEDMVRAVRKAIDILPGIDPQIMHLRVSFILYTDLSLHWTPVRNGHSVSASPLVETLYASSCVLIHI
jgi:hypothetical protein